MFRRAPTLYDVVSSPQDSPDELAHSPQISPTDFVLASEEKPYAVNWGQVQENLVGGVIDQVTLACEGDLWTLGLRVVHEEGPTVQVDVRDIELPIIIDAV